MQRTATSTWKGNVKEGHGSITTQSGALSAQPFGFNTRFEDEPGTNPEELIAAAHAGCFAMALSNELGMLDIEPNRIEAEAAVHLEQSDGGFVITKSAITVTADVGDAKDDDFNKAVSNAKQNCPVSNALSAEVTVSVDRVR